MKLISFMIVISACYILNADPLIVKGVDGTWLPVIASSWSERNNGVIVVLKENAEIEKIRIKLSETFPNLRIEVSGNALFFNSTNIESLFSLLNGAETGVVLPEKKLPDPSSRLFAPQSTELAPDEVEGTVESLSFDTKTGHFFINITTKTGKMTIQVIYKMKDGKADTNDEKNKHLSRLLLLKKGNVIVFKPVRTAGSKFTSISDYLIRK